MARLTQSDAAMIYAKAWNTLDPATLESVLDDCVEVSSQGFLEDLIGRDAYMTHVVDKMAAVRRSGLPVRVFAELGTISAPDPQPCVIVAQGSIDRLEAVVVFEVCASAITRIVACTGVPHPTSAIRSGDYPGPSLP